MAIKAPETVTSDQHSDISYWLDAAIQTEAYHRRQEKNYATNANYNHIKAQNLLNGRDAAQVRRAKRAMPLGERFKAYLFGLDEIDATEHELDQAKALEESAISLQIPMQIEQVLRVAADILILAGLEELAGPLREDLWQNVVIANKN